MTFSISVKEDKLPARDINNLSLDSTISDIKAIMSDKFGIPSKI